MGRFEITLNDLENHLSSIQDSHYVDIFLNDFFEIGFTKSSYQVLDQNYQDNNIQINFTYDDLIKHNNENLYNKFLNYLQKVEKYDDVLFYIAEIFFNEFNNYKSNYELQFKIIKETFVKRSDFKDLINKVNEKIRLFERLLNQVEQNYKRSRNILNNDLSKIINNFEPNKFNNGFLKSLSYEIDEFENNTNSFFESDFEKTKHFFLNTIDSLRILKERISEYEIKLYNSQEENNLMSNQVMYEESSNLESAMFQPRYLNKEAFEELEKSEEILSFDDIAENVFTRLNVSLNSDIYINFLALRRIEQHYKEIKFLKDNVGQILKK